MDAPHWKPSLAATWTWSLTRCHRTCCTPTRPTSHWAYSRGGRGCGRPPPCSLKVNNGRQRGERGLVQTWTASAVRITLMMSDARSSGLHSDRPRTCSPWHAELIIWLMSVSFLHCQHDLLKLLQISHCIRRFFLFAVAGLIYYDDSTNCLSQQMQKKTKKHQKLNHWNCSTSHCFESWCLPTN